MKSPAAILLSAALAGIASAAVTVDGVAVADLQNGDEVVVSKSRHDTLMADLGLKSFYEIAYEKLI